ncbi:MAG: lipid-A-disaccharide synthase N-terminal domain-containing protein [Hyphomicrobiales bacterium]|nr:lipid-A-disaccharide synthase N-terminal domain-containing protein [Hyphomicrobiales bacterium]
MGEWFAGFAAEIGRWWTTVPTVEIIWLTIGFGAQMMFSMRFLVQWIASERARESIVPETFWYFSFVGGLMMLTYAVYRKDPVFILGQALGLVVYSRNIYLIWRNKRLNAEVSKRLSRASAGFKPAE